MSDLLNKKCIPCEGGILPFDISEIYKYQKKVDGWDVSKNEKKIYFLKKIFLLKILLIARTLLIKLVKSPKQKAITQIFLLDGAMQKL